MGPAAGRCGKGVAASRTCCGKALLVLGPICMGLGVLAAMMVNKEYPKRIRDFAVVHAGRGMGYKMWMTNAGRHGAPRYYGYTFSTITNAQEFLNGEAPVYEEKGPYVFRTDYKRVNVNFEDDGRLVTFQEKYVSRFDPHMSKGSIDDQLNILNPAWVGIVSNYHSESKVKQGAQSVALGKLWDNFNHVMLPMSRLDALQTALVKARDGLNLAMGMLKYPRDSFFAAWGGGCVSNGTQPELCGFNDLSWLVAAGLLPSKQDRQYLLADLLVNLPMAKTIPLDKALRMWNASDPYSLVSFHEVNATVTKPGVFQGVATWVQAAHDAHKAQLLAEHFDLSLEQVSVIAKRLDSAKDSDELFHEVRDRYLRTVPEAKRAGIAARLGSIKDFVWWQLYTGEVLPALKNKPTASLKKEAKFEYGWYTRTRLNKTAEETGVDFKTVYCLFDYADANISLLESKVLGIDRWWLNDKAPEFSADTPRPPKYTFEECFPDDKAIQAMRGYTEYLVDIFFMPAYTEYLQTNGLVANKTAGHWVLGNGPLDIIYDAFRHTTDPRINFSLLMSDSSLNGEARCAGAADVTQAYTTCRKVSGNGHQPDYYVRGNYTLYTGKDDINQVGQLKRLYGQEVMDGVWAKKLVVDHGAAAMVRDADQQWDLKPILPGHIDGLSVPPGILLNNDLENGFLSFMIESVSAPFPMIYEGDIVRRGIKLRRFVMHPDALSAHRPDAATFSMGHPDTPAELMEVFNMTEARQGAFFIGPVGKTKVLDTRNSRMAADRQQQQQRPALSPDTVSYIEFEPITGLAMRVNLQVQMYTTLLPQYVKYDIWSPHVHESALAPIFKLHITQDMSADEARMFRHAVYGARELSKGSFIGGFVIGSVMMVIGFALLLASSDIKWCTAKKLQPPTPTPV